MRLIDLINQLINEHGSATIMGERLNLARDQAQALEKQLAALVVENAALKQRVAQLEQQVAAQTALEEFVECRGALFKRKPGGGYHLAVYCPHCNKPVASIENEPQAFCGQ